VLNTRVCCLYVVVCSHSLVYDLVLIHLLPVSHVIAGDCKPTFVGLGSVTSILVLCSQPGVLWLLYIAKLFLFLCDE